VSCGAKAERRKAARKRSSSAAPAQGNALRGHRRVASIAFCEAWPDGEALFCIEASSHLRPHLCAIASMQSNGIFDNEKPAF
jgi:hypothetical protein